MSRTRITLTGGEGMMRALAAIAPGANELRVGFIEGATYPANGDEILKVAQVAFWNEFGTATAPARPFFRTMIEKKSPKWGAVLAANLQATGYNWDTSLKRLGLVIKEQLTQSIVEFDDPPNAPYTVAKKGFNNPLIDTGVMQRQTGYEVGPKQ